VEAEKETSRDVTCADFKILRDPGGGRELEEVPWNTLFPPHPITRETCLLATLPPGGGKIALEAKASLGTGRENARWQPTSQCTYTYTRDADNVARMEAHLRKWLSEAKKQNLDDLKKGEEPLVSLLREFNTMEVNRVFKENEKGEPYSFDFVVESVGVLDPVYIVQRACEARNLVPAAPTPDAAVVIDVLRATTTIICALRCGAEAVQVFAELDALETAVLKGQLRHNSPVLDWNAASAVVTQDPAGLRKLDKARSVERIDGLVALGRKVTRVRAGQTYAKECDRITVRSGDAGDLQRLFSRKEARLTSNRTPIKRVIWWLVSLACTWLPA
jgi:hypothetical protein